MITGLLFTILQDRRITLMSIAGIEKSEKAETSSTDKKTSEEAAAQIIADGRRNQVLLEDAEKGAETYKAAIAFAEAKAESYQKKIDSEAVWPSNLKPQLENLM